MKKNVFYLTYKETRPEELVEKTLYYQVIRRAPNRFDNASEALDWCHKLNWYHLTEQPWSVHNEADPNYCVTV